VTDPQNNTNNTLTNDKRNKVIEAIYRFDSEKLKAFANDDTLVNVPIQEVRLFTFCLLRFSERAFVTSPCY